MRKKPRILFWLFFGILIGFSVCYALFKQYGFHFHFTSDDIASYERMVCPEWEGTLASRRLYKEFSTSMKPEEIRKNIPLWLRVSQWGDVGLTSIKREPFEKPFELEHIGKVGPFQVSAKHQYLFSAVSAVGHFHFIYLEPEDPLDSGGICIMQHGCECLASFSGLFANSINQLLEQGVGVILPVQPYVKPCSDFMVSSTLYMMDRNMMGLRVTLIRGIIDWIEETRPEAKVVLVGHSMGSMVSYFTAAVDERLAGVALDYNDRPTEMIHSPIRTSTVPGLVFLLGKGGMLREEFLQVRSIHRQEYGYPDREALARWVQANTKTVQ